MRAEEEVEEEEEETQEVTALPEMRGEAAVAAAGEVRPTATAEEQEAPETAGIPTWLLLGMAGSALGWCLVG